MSSSLPAQLPEVVCAHSPDSDDAYMFYGLATGKIASSQVAFRQVMADIETLNQKAKDGVYDLTAVSYHAYPYIADKYVLMASGSSIGDNYGPIVVSVNPLDITELKGKRIAIPGKMTSAYLTLKLLEPDFVPVPMPFDQILEAVSERTVDAGLVIHEGQLTYGHSGLHAAVDLGKWWKSKFHLPLPLGANALLRRLPDSVKSECARLMRASIEYSLANRPEALAYAMQFARDLETPLADRFIGMYVNHHTVDCGDDVPKAAQLMYDMGFEAGIIPHRITVEFVR